MGEELCRIRHEIFDYATYKTDIPLEGEKRYFNGILTGIVHPCYVLGDGSSRCDQLPFEGTIHIETAINVSLETLRIDRNHVSVKNTHTDYINIDLGITGTELYYRLKSGGIAEFIYNGTSWVNQTPDNAKLSIMDDSPVYLMSTFTEPDLFLYASGDGKKWKSLSGGVPVYTGDDLRDPSIMYRNGKYWICYTNVSTGAIDHNEFKIISSEDLINWEAVATIDCSAIAGAPAVGARVWAPEWYVDNDDTVYIFVSIKPDAGSAHTGYYLVAQNENMTAFSDPVAISITGANAPTNWIDGFIIKKGATYYLWYKDEDSKYIEYATSIMVTGPYVNQEHDDWAGWGNALEGPCIVQIDDTRYRIYMHDYPDDGIYWSDSVDNFASWSAKALIDESITTTNYLLEHCTVLKIDNFKIMADMIALLFSNENSFRGNVELTNHGILITDFDAGARFLMDGVAYGHFIGTVTGDNSLYIDNRGADSTLIRYYDSGWFTAIEIENGGSVKIKKSIGLEGILTISSSSDAVDVTGIGIVRVNTDGGNVVIGGFANGYQGQIIIVYKHYVTNDLTLEHYEATGTQKIVTDDGADIVFAGTFGTIAFCFLAGFWRPCRY
jgi:hypothetical protein